MKEWVRDEGEKLQHGKEDKYMLTPYVAVADADDGAAMPNRGILTLVSNRLEERLSRTEERVEGACRGRGMVLRFQSGARVVAVYGVAGSDGDEAP